ncbi:hypothetical protein [Pseudomonas donghuensis]|uniref:hypothetical protein n=1 Tax=Pseudomonas donghuensis TaxID=1163398 RepID=UPI002E14EC13|nr:hypothetical protein VP780_13800 [Pseudomonas donghuensis]
MLTVLSEAFPNPISLDFQELGLADGPATVAKDFDELQTEYMPQHVFAAQCVQFLVDEEFVSGKAHHYWAASVQLTAKGIDLIGATPRSLRSSNYL